MGSKVFATPQKSDHYHEGVNTIEADFGTMVLQVPVQGFLNSAAVEAKESGASWCYDGIWEPPHGRRNSHRATAISKTSTSSITRSNIASDYFGAPFLEVRRHGYGSDTSWALKGPWAAFGPKRVPAPPLPPTLLLDKSRVVVCGNLRRLPPLLNSGKLLLLRSCHELIA